MNLTLRTYGQYGHSWTRNEFQYNVIIVTSHLYRFDDSIHSDDDLRQVGRNIYVKNITSSTTRNKLFISPCAVNVEIPVQILPEL